MTHLNQPTTRNLPYATTSLSSDAHTKTFQELYKEVTYLRRLPPMRRYWGTLAGALRQSALLLTRSSFEHPSSFGCHPGTTQSAFAGGSFGPELGTVGSSTLTAHPLLCLLQSG